MAYLLIFNNLVYELIIIKILFLINIIILDKLLNIGFWKYIIFYIDYIDLFYFMTYFDYIISLTFWLFLK